jgi:outer membrane protein OmpA-like peptidoglycan-associated protein
MRSLSHSAPRRSLTVALALLAGLAPAAAHAQDAVAAGNGKGFDTHLFRPALDSKGFFTVNGTEVLGAKDLSFGLVLDYGNGLLRVPDKGQSGTNLIEHSFQGTVHFNYGIANRLIVGISAPINLLAADAQYDNAAPPNATVNTSQWSANQLDAQSLSYVAAHGKFRILRVEDGFGLSVAAQAGTSIGSAPKNGAADPGFWYWPQLLAEKRFGKSQWLKIGVNGGFRGHSASGTKLDLKNGTFVDGSRGTFGGAVAIRVAPPLDIVGETYGTYLLSSAASADTKLSTEAIVGVKLFVEQNSYLMLGGGKRLTGGFEGADWRGFLGFVFEPSIGDADGDHIKDDIDKCPLEAEDFDGFEDSDGCPEPDNDKDGIPDLKDRCVNEPEDKDGDEDWDGCPESRDGDRDHDGIIDRLDKCPDVPEDKDGIEDDDGCPEDNDKDGIPDAVDKCPMDFGIKEFQGCPEPDTDHDGILDLKDKCPTVPETFNGIDDEDGCPDKGDVEVTDGGIVILKKIQFKTGSAEILSASNPILDAVAAAIKGHPEFLLVEVAGHADERNDDDKNLKLTQKRVENVVAELAKRGVASDRLRAKGYGEYCPEDPGHNEKAWEKNRRVEFKIVKNKDNDTKVETGCDNAEKHGVFSD